MALHKPSPSDHPPPFLPRLMPALLLVWVMLCSCVGGQKVSPRVELILSRPFQERKVQESINLWVYFKDKGVDNEFEILHPHTAWRRSKVLESLQSDEDLPVYPEYISQVEEIGATKRRESKWLNAISVTIESTSNSEEIVNSIADLSFVDRVDVVDRYSRTNLDIPDDLEVAGFSKRDTHSFDYGTSFDQLNLINVPQLHDQGYNGTGVVIAIFDTGFMKDHPCILPLNIIGEWDFLQNDNDTQSNPPDAQLTHGTATLSDLGGWDPSNLIGAAFGASFLLAKTESVAYESVTEEDNFIAALEWAESKGADIVSASLGYNKWYTYYQKDGATIPVTKAVDAAVRKGMVVVVSAGNYGPAGISAPADAFEVISVGSVSQDRTPNTWSSVGPSADGRMKPEVAARGSQNWVANAYTVPNNQKGTSLYTQSSGTSFACPIVAGVAALLLQAHPDWTPHMVKEALLMTSSNPDEPNTFTGWGVVNAVNAMIYSPIRGNCTTNGCSDLGCCGNSTCNCVPSKYGTSCNFDRVPCAAFCGSITYQLGLCVLQPAGASFRCGAPNGSATENVVAPTCDGCPLDYCGVCFGRNSTCDVRCPQGTPHCSHTTSGHVAVATTASSTQNFGPNYLFAAIVLLIFALMPFI